MAELDDIGFELRDRDEESLNILDDCPSPPPPFNRDNTEKQTIIQPPVTFNDQNPTITIKNIVPFDNIFFNDAKIHLLEAMKSNPTPTSTTARRSENNAFFRFVNFLRSAMTSNHTLEFNRQCEQLLQLTTYSCDLTDRIHIRILYTIYRRLTNSKEVFYAVQGPHWESIGFQTSNPETDFRSTGLFSMFLLLYFVDSMYLPLAKQIYQLSQDEQQQFPFCCIGINLAGIIIKGLRRTSSRKSIEKLVEEKKTDTMAIELSGKLFIALFLSFYLKWQENACTIEQTQVVLNELDRLLMHQPKVLIQEFNNYFQRKHTENASETAHHYAYATTNDDRI